MDLKISAFIPFFTRINYLEKTLISLFENNYIFNKILIIDDGSNNENNLQFLKNFDRVFLIKNKKNMGRGYCRNLAINVLSDPFILMIDASNCLHPSFVKIALPHFKSDDISAVSGLIKNKNGQVGFSSNWRGRHLFKQDHNFGKSHHDAVSLTTYGTILRRSAVLDVGNFNPSLRHSEDKDLGIRLLNCGYKIIGDPNLVVYSIKKDSVLSVLERYWRWYGGEDENMSLSDYLNAIKASFKPMMQLDLKAKDWRALFISFICPHYGYLRHLYRKTTGKLQKTH